MAAVEPSDTEELGAARRPVIVQALRSLAPPGFEDTGRSIPTATAADAAGSSRRLGRRTRAFLLVALAALIGGVAVTYRLRAGLESTDHAVVAARVISL